MTNKNYAKGYRLENAVRKMYQEDGALVIRQAKSKFPDLIIIKEDDGQRNQVLFIECKTNKYLSAEERAHAAKIQKYGRFLIAYKKDKKICFCTLQYTNL